MKNILLQYCTFYLAILLLSPSILAQNTAPYVDKSGQFKVFDNGKIHGLEHEEVTEVKIGGDYVIYKDEAGQKKQYFNGETKDINNLPNVSHHPTRYLMGIVEGLKGETLKVQYADSEELLSIDMDKGAFATRDSVLVFKDNYGELTVFYEGKTHLLGEDLNCRVSSNSVVFMDSTNVMSLFHEGKVTEIYREKVKNHYEFGFAARGAFGDDKEFENPAASKNKEMASKIKKTGQMRPDLFRASQAVLTYEGKKFRSKSISYKHYLLTAPNDFLRKTINCRPSYVTCWYAAPYHVGDNFVVFVDENGKLIAYDEGILSEVADFQPKNYRVGAKMIIFVDEFDALMVYWNGKTQKLTESFPRFQAIKKNTLVYADDLGFFHVFDKGKKITLEAYQPSYVAMNEGIVVYTDRDGLLKAYYEGKKLDISKVIVKNFQLIGRVILYTVGNNETKIFYNGNHYSG
ncbi:MAG: hypothetical protein ACPGVB_10975 [Chitinophagales bacterium]